MTSVGALALLDRSADPAFDRLARLAATMLATPAALVSIVDDDRQVLKGFVGLPEPWASEREVPLSHSFCQHTVRSARPLIIGDARKHPLVREHGALGTLGVAAYVGIPLVVADGSVLGSFCVLDTAPRVWTPREVALLSDLAASAMTEIELRFAAAEAERARADAEAARQDAEAARAAASARLVVAETLRSDAEVAQEDAQFGWAAAREDAEWARAAATTARAAAAEALRAKASLLTTMSHEFRTPLNAIGGHADLIAMGIHGPVSPAQLDALSRIKKSGDHLMHLVEDLLSFARLDRDATDIELSVIPIAALLDEIWAMVRPEMMSRGLVFEQQPCDPALGARANVHKVRQVLINLLSNAMKFTERGGRVTMDCGTREGAGGAHWTWITVADTGVGIAADRLAAVFEPFVQDIPRGHASEGIGLGLSISRGLARAMGGDLTVESVAGAGSTFTLTLPRADAA